MGTRFGVKKKRGAKKSRGGNCDHSLGHSCGRVTGGEDGVHSLVVIFPRVNHGGERGREAQGEAEAQAMEGERGRERTAAWGESRASGVGVVFTPGRRRRSGPPTASDD